MSAETLNKKRAICGICSAGCWVIVTYDGDGKISKVESDSSSALGMICRLGEFSPQVVYSKDRIPYPMRRKGPKGTLDFERISWDEAYDTIVDKLNTIKKESGPEATAVYTGSGSFELANCDFFQPKGVAVSSASSVLFPFGSPNTMGVGALCYVSFAMIAPHVTMGGMFINMYSDMENAKLIVVWGKNPAAHCPPDDFIRIEKAHKRGARIIVIDPRKTVMANYDNAEWIPIRPGTDGALALGLCNVLIEEELYDESFVDNWTVGFDEFNSYVQHFRPEVVEGITGIPAETVRTLARQIAQTDGVAPVMYSGLEYSDGAVQAIRATFVLWALAGNMDVPGGRCFKMAANKFPLNKDGNLANPDVRRAAGFNNFPIYSKYRGEFHANILPQAVLEGRPYPIRSVLSLGASIITSWPQSDIWEKTLAALDFLVCIDRQWTKDMEYADIVLPATTYYEIQSYMVYDSVFKIREKVIEPVGEARNDFLIMADLANRLGYGHLYPQSEDEILESVLKGSGYTVDDVRAAGGSVQVETQMMQYKKWEKGLLRLDGQPGFDTPSGKFEIASSILEEHGYDALPIYTEPGESPQSQPELAKRYPLVFNSGSRTNVDLHTLHHSVPQLQQERPVPTVMMNTADARERGIENGDYVYIESKRGRVGMYAQVTDAIVKGAVEASGMGGGALGSDAWRNANANRLTDLSRYDPISGFPVYKALLCEVVKVEEGDKQDLSGSWEYNVDNSIEEDQVMQRIYLDHNATTPIASGVQQAMVKYMEHYGNPSSIYAAGKEAHVAVENARRALAILINCTARRLIFTGGGSESNNLAIKGVAYASDKLKNHIITSVIEHPSVLNTCKWLEGQGYSVIYLPVDKYGRVSPNDLKSAITDSTCLVTIMMANNETGSIQPIGELAAIAHERGVIFHADGAQAVGKMPVDVEALGIDLLSMSAHKLYGPKGVGALYVRKGIALDSLISGGGQEGGLRAGTENTLGIVGLGIAAELSLGNLNGLQALQNLRDRLQKAIGDIIPEIRLNGHAEERLANTLNLVIPGVRGESLVLALDQRGIAISSGSACRAGTPEPSHALMAMGISEDDAHCSVRISLGYENTIEEIDRAVEAIDEIVHNKGSQVRFVSCR
ncbi:MAG: IscS subfamily cysteine desulfurase [Chloroflexi bacterium]|jgi:cysteine desulfurase NifS|nr:IscS subfamily cysteine desulfurase [Chloroflexota bacterium]MBT7081732.1 IscS subfamily cysteine desulfurase [Chloroflexota bacterium]